MEARKKILLSVPESRRTDRGKADAAARSGTRPTRNRSGMRLKTILYRRENSPKYSPVSVAPQKMELLSIREASPYRAVPSELPLEVRGTGYAGCRNIKAPWPECGRRQSAPPRPLPLDLRRQRVASSGRAPQAPGATPRQKCSCGTAPKTAGRRDSKDPGGAVFARRPQHAGRG